MWAKCAAQRRATTSNLTVLGVGWRAYGCRVGSGACGQPVRVPGGQRVASCRLCCARTTTGARSRGRPGTLRRGGLRAASNRQNRQVLSAAVQLLLESEHGSCQQCDADIAVPVQSESAHLARKSMHAVHMGGLSGRVHPIPRAGACVNVGQRRHVLVYL